MTISKGSPGTPVGPSWGVSGNGLYIAEGEVSGGQNWGELPQEPRVPRMGGVSGMCHTCFMGRVDW